MRAKVPMAVIECLWTDCGLGALRRRMHISTYGLELAPSAALRKDYHNSAIDYEAFKEAYGGELMQNVELTRFVRLIEGNKQDVVTLLTAVKDVRHSHVPALMNKIAALSTKRELMVER